MISGYLISRNIIEAFSEQRFSFKAFYIRRFRRLFPALVTTILLTAIVAPMILLPEHLERFGWEAFWSFFSISNIYFWSESGYFDLDADLKPLLHTWSLSVEEQFYLIWPALLLLMSKANSRLAYLCFITIIGLISLAAAEYFISIEDTSTAFYLLPFRVVEFVMGMSVVILEFRYKNKGLLASNLMVLSGLALISYTCFFYTAETPFPGLTSLLPCIGAALVIFAGGTVITQYFLQNSVITFLGRISYSIYLVHWPLVVFYKYRKAVPLNEVEQCLIVLASIVLAYIMWRFIEQPFRFAKQTTSQHSAKFKPGKFKLGIVPYIGLTASCALGLSITFVASDGNFIQGRHAASPAVIDVVHGKQDRYKLLKDPCVIHRLDNNELCQMDKPIQALIFGNSHEPDGYNIWHTAYGGNPALNIVLFGTINHCKKYFSATKKHSGDDKFCFERIEAMRNPEIVNRLDMVIFSFNKPYSTNKKVEYDLLLTMKEINPKLKIVILGGYLNTSKDCSYIYGLFGDFSKCGDAEFLNYSPEDERKQFQEWLKAPYFKALSPVIIDKFSLLCRNGKNCETSVAGVPYAYDKHHLSYEFAAYIGERIQRKYGDKLLAGS